MSTVHVWPSSDVFDHDVESDDCVCGPEVEAVPGDDGSFGWLLTHHLLMPERTTK